MADEVTLSGNTYSGENMGTGFGHNVREAAGSDGVVRRRWVNMWVDGLADMAASLGAALSHRNGAAASAAAAAASEDNAAASAASITGIETVVAGYRDDANLSAAAAAASAASVDPTVAPNAGKPVLRDGSGGAFMTSATLEAADPALVLFDTDGSPGRKMLTLRSRSGEAGAWEISFVGETTGTAVATPFIVACDGTRQQLRAHDAELWISDRPLFVKTHFERKIAVAYASTIALDLSAGHTYEIGALTGSLTLANPINLQPSDSYLVANQFPNWSFVACGTIVIPQDPVGGRTIAFGTAWNFAERTVPTLSTAPNAVDHLDFMVLGNSIFANLRKNVGR